MIRALKQFVLWLESRFPEKVVVTAEHMARLEYSLADLSRRCEEIAAVKERVSAVEYKSAHVDAVKELVAVVQLIKNDVDAMKNNLGWSKPSEKQAELQALLNGEVI